jgi:hypothetical protein
MNNLEMAKILRIMQEHYSDKEVTQQTVNAWYPVFRDYDFNTVQLAVAMMAKEREYTSFPAPASLVKYIGIITGKSDPTALWELAHRAMGKASTFTRETFAELPEELQRFFGSINQLREYGLMDVDKIGIVKNAFMKELPVIETRIMARNETAKLTQAASGKLDEQHAKQLTEFLGGGE